MSGTESGMEKDAQILGLLREIKALNEELETTNLGLMALHKELDERSAQLSISKNAAEAANRVYEALLQSAGDLGQGVIVSRGPTHIHYANEAFAAIAGRDLSGIRSTDPDVSQFLGPAGDRRVPIMAGNETGIKSRHYETRIERPDGNVADVEVASTAFAIHGESYRLALLRDVTKTKHDTVELEKTRQQLAVSEKLAALGSLVSGVAHEVRTPLTIIANNLHVLDRRATMALQSGDFASLAQQVPLVTGEVLLAIDRVQLLVKSLGRFSQNKPLTTLCPMDPIVREALDLFVAVNRSHTRVESDLRSQIPVLVDKSQVQQIVINLLENATQASQESSEPVKLRTYDAPQGAGVTLEVRDFGIGMTQDTLDRMFEPLFTTKAEGTGVGLTIVERIVQQHGATIQCQSALGQGTTFTVTFPAPANEAAAKHPLGGAQASPPMQNP